MAAALLTAIPIAVLYAFAQRFLVEGLTVGGVKG
jgi:multiple sugar transport system permease protein